MFRKIIYLFNICIDIRILKGTFSYVRVIGELCCYFALLQHRMFFTLKCCYISNGCPKVVRDSKMLSPYFAVLIDFEILARLLLGKHINSVIYGRLWDMMVGY